MNLSWLFICPINPFPLSPHWKAAHKAAFRVLRFPSWHESQHSLLAIALQNATGGIPTPHVDTGAGGSYYMRIIKQGRFSESINASAPSGMIGRYSNVHQWLRCETERNLGSIHQVCDNLSSRYNAKLCLIQRLMYLRSTYAETIDSLFSAENQVEDNPTNYGGDKNN